MYCHQIRFDARQIYMVYILYIVYICVHVAVLSFTAFKTIGEELDKQTNHHLQVCLYARVPHTPEGTKISPAQLPPPPCPLTFNSSKKQRSTDTVQCQDNQEEHVSEPATRPCAELAVQPEGELLAETHAGLGEIKETLVAFAHKIVPTKGIRHGRPIGTCGPIVASL